MSDQFPSQPGQPDLNPGDVAPESSDSVGEDLCPECGGQGKTDAGEDCPGCEGTGTVTEPVGGG